MAREGGSIARRIPVPDVAKLSFRLEWGSSLRFRAILLADAGGTLQPDNCYDLVMQRRFVYLRKRWRTGEQRGARSISTAQIAALAEASEAEFEICFHRPSGTIALFVNGTRAQVWKDQELEEGELGAGRERHPRRGRHGGEEGWAMAQERLLRRVLTAD